MSFFPYQYYCVVTREIIHVDLSMCTGIRKSMSMANSLICMGFVIVSHNAVFCHLHAISIHVYPLGKLLVR